MLLGTVVVNVVVTYVINTYKLYWLLYEVVTPHQCASNLILISGYDSYIRTYVHTCTHILGYLIDLSQDSLLSDPVHAPHTYRFLGSVHLQDVRLCIGNELLTMLSLNIKSLGVVGLYFIVLVAILFSRSSVVSCCIALHLHSLVFDVYKISIS